MINAKIIINFNTKIFEELRKTKNFATLKFSFNPPDEKKSIVFFISTKVHSYKLYNPDDNTTYMVNLSFTQKPSDFLIEKIGEIIDENEKIEKRKDIRINLNSDNLKILEMESNNIISKIDNIDRKCLLRNISASGAVILFSGIPKYLINKKIILKFNAKRNKLNLPGEGRKER